VEFALHRQPDTKTVVFEYGLMGGLYWWSKVYPEVEKEATVFAYNRPGYGRSEAVATPRDGAHIVEELRALLRAQNLPPPYILVGHSAGGLYMQYFARRHPSEVAALVLVDSVHPTQFEGPEAPENWPKFYAALFQLAGSRVDKAELAAIPTTGKEVLLLPTVTGKPVLILSASKTIKISREIDGHSMAKRKDLPRLYPGSRQIWVDSTHWIPAEKPEAVVGAIREVLQKP
jgi:pimeloyl-ACP methyl ester carboxylesterase